MENKMAEFSVCSPEGPADDDDIEIVDERHGFEEASNLPFLTVLYNDVDFTMTTLLPRQPPIRVDDEEDVKPMLELEVHDEDVKPMLELEDVKPMLELEVHDEDVKPMLELEVHDEDVSPSLDDKICCPSHDRTSPSPNPSPVPQDNVDDVNMTVDETTALSGEEHEDDSNIETNDGSLTTVDNDIPQVFGSVIQFAKPPPSTQIELRPPPGVIVRIFETQAVVPPPSIQPPPSAGACSAISNQLCDALPRIRSQSVPCTYQSSYHPPPRIIPHDVPSSSMSSATSTPVSVSQTSVITYSVSSTCRSLSPTTPSPPPALPLAQFAGDPRYAKSVLVNAATDDAERFLDEYSSTIAKTWLMFYRIKTLYDLSMVRGVAFAREKCLEKYRDYKVYLAETRPKLMYLLYSLLGVFSKRDLMDRVFHKVRLILTCVLEVKYNLDVYRQFFGAFHGNCDVMLAQSFPALHEVVAAPSTDKTGSPGQSFAALHQVPETPSPPSTDKTASPDQSFAALHQVPETPSPPSTDKTASPDQSFAALHQVPETPSPSSTDKTAYPGQSFAALHQVPETPSPSSTDKTAYPGQSFAALHQVPETPSPPSTDKTASPDQSFAALHQVPETPSPPSTDKTASPGQSFAALHQVPETPSPPSTDKTVSPGQSFAALHQVPETPSPPSTDKTASPGQSFAALHQIPETPSSMSTDKTVSPGQAENQPALQGPRTRCETVAISKHGNTSRQRDAHALQYQAGVPVPLYQRPVCVQKQRLRLSHVEQQRCAEMSRQRELIRHQRSQQTSELQNNAGHIADVIQQQEVQNHVSHAQTEKSRGQLDLKTQDLNSRWPSNILQTSNLNVSSRTSDERQLQVVTSSQQVDAKRPCTWKDVPQGNVILDCIQYTLQRQEHQVSALNQSDVHSKRHLSAVQLQTELAAEKQVDLRVAQQVGEKQVDLRVAQQVGEKQVDLTVAQQVGEKQVDLRVAQQVGEKQVDLTVAQQVGQGVKRKLDFQLDARDQSQVRDQITEIGEINARDQNKVRRQINDNQIRHQITEIGEVNPRDHNEMGQQTNDIVVDYSDSSKMRHKINKLVEIQTAIRMLEDDIARRETPEQSTTNQTASNKRSNVTCQPLTNPPASSHQNPQTESTSEDNQHILNAVTPKSTIQDRIQCQKQKVLVVGGNGVNERARAPPTLSPNVVIRAPPPLSPNGVIRAPPPLSPNGVIRAPPTLSPNGVIRAPPTLTANNVIRAPPTLTPNNVIRAPPTLTANNVIRAPPSLTPNYVIRAPPTLTPNNVIRAPPPLTPNYVIRAPPPLTPNYVIRAPPTLSPNNVIRAPPTLTAKNVIRAPPSLTPNYVIRAPPTLTPNNVIRAPPPLTPNYVIRAPPPLTPNYVIRAPPTLSPNNVIRAPSPLTPNYVIRAPPTLTPSEVMQHQEAGLSEETNVQSRSWSNPQLHNQYTQCSRNERTNSITIYRDPTAQIAEHNRAGNRDVCEKSFSHSPSPPHRPELVAHVGTSVNPNLALPPVTNIHHNRPNIQATQDIHNHPFSQAAQNIHHNRPNFQGTQNVQHYRPNFQATQNVQHNRPNFQATQNNQHNHPNFQGTQNVQHNHPNFQGTQNNQHNHPNFQGTQNVQHNHPNFQGTQNVQHNHPNFQGTQNVQHNHPNFQETQNNQHYRQNLQENQNAQHYRSKFQSTQNIQQNLSSLQTTQNIQHNRPNLQATQNFTLPTFPNVQHDRSTLQVTQNIHHNLSSLQTTQNIQHNRSNLQTTQNIQHNQPSLQATQNIQHNQPSLQATQNIPHNRSNLQTTQNIQHNQPSLQATQNIQHNQPSLQATQNIPHNRSNLQTTQNIQHNQLNLQATHNIGRVYPGVAQQPSIWTPHLGRNDGQPNVGGAPSVQPLLELRRMLCRTLNNNTMSNANNSLNNVTHVQQKQVSVERNISQEGMRSQSGQIIANRRNILSRYEQDIIKFIRDTSVSATVDLRGHQMLPQNDLQIRANQSVPSNDASPSMLPTQRSYSRPDSTNRPSNQQLGATISNSNQQSVGSLPLSRDVLDTNICTSNVQQVPQISPLEPQPVTSINNQQSVGSLPLSRDVLDTNICTSNVQQVPQISPLEPQPVTSINNQQSVGSLPLSRDVLDTNICTSNVQQVPQISPLEPQPVASINNRQVLADRNVTKERSASVSVNNPDVVQADKHSHPSTKSRSAFRYVARDMPSLDDTMEDTVTSSDQDTARSSEKISSLDSDTSRPKMRASEKIPPLGFDIERRKPNVLKKRRRLDSTEIAWPHTPKKNKKSKQEAAKKKNKEAQHKTTSEKLLSDSYTGVLQKEQSDLVDSTSRPKRKMRTRADSNERAWPEKPKKISKSKTIEKKSKEAKRNEEEIDSCSDARTLNEGSSSDVSTRNSKEKVGYTKSIRIRDVDIFPESLNRNFKEFVVDENSSKSLSNDPDLVSNRQTQLQCSSNTSPTLATATETAVSNPPEINPRVNTPEPQHGKVDPPITATSAMRLVRKMTTRELDDKLRYYIDKKKKESSVRSPSPKTAILLHDTASPVGKKVTKTKKKRLEKKIPLSSLENKSPKTLGHLQKNRLLGNYVIPKLQKSSSKTANYSSDTSSCTDNAHDNPKQKPASILANASTPLCLHTVKDLLLEETREIGNKTSTGEKYIKSPPSLPEIISSPAKSTISEATQTPSTDISIDQTTSPTLVAPVVTLPEPTPGCQPLPEEVTSPTPTVQQREVKLEAVETDGVTRPMMMEAVETDGVTRPMKKEAVETDVVTRPMKVQAVETDGVTRPMMMEAVDDDDVVFVCSTISDVIVLDDDDDDDVIVLDDNVDVVEVTQSGAGKNDVIKQLCVVCGLAAMGACAMCKQLYCSNTCLENDWYDEHQFSCPGLVTEIS